MKRSSVEALIGLLALAAVARAQDTTRLAPIVVTATRTPENAATLGNSVTVLSGESLRHAGITTVAEALRGVTSVALAQAGSWGAQTSLFLRGGESDYVRVLVDGVPLNQAGGAIDLAYLSTDDVDRIEIVRGPSSVLYGSDAMTGVIQIITRSGNGRWGAGRGTSLMLAAQGGGRGSSVERGELATGGRILGVSAGFEHESTNGIYDFNNHHDNTAETARLTITPDRRTDFALTLRHRDGVFHFPTDGSGNPVDSNSFGKSRQSILALDAGRRLGRAVEMRALLGYADERDSSDNQPDFAGDPNGSSESGRGVRRRSADLRAIIQASNAWKVTVGGAFEDQRERDQSTFTSPSFSSASKTDTSRTNKALYAEANGGIGRLSLQTGVRFDRNEVFGDFTTWRLGASLRLSAATRLRAAAGTAFKEPTFDQTFNTAFSTGNPGLKPERSRSFEAGIDHWFGSETRLSVTGFTQRFQDVIEYAYGGGPPNPDYQNISSAHASGVETELQLRPMRELSLTASYTWLKTVAGDSGSDAFVFAKGQSLIRRPASSAAVSADWRSRVGVRVNYVGKRDDVTFVGFTEERVTLSAYTRVDAWARVPLVSERGGETFALTGRLENAFDTSYQDIFGFKAPGLRIMLGAELALR